MKYKYTVDPNIAQQNQANAASQQHAVQQAAGQQQMQQINNQVGSILTYNGQAPQILQSQYCPSGTAYQVGGTIITNPRDISIMQMEELKREYILKKKASFLKHPVRFREAFLSEMMADVVAKDMNDSSAFFGVNRQGYSSLSNQGGLNNWIPGKYDVNVEISLEQYEEWHSEDLMDKVLEE